MAGVKHESKWIMVRCPVCGKEFSRYRLSQNKKFCSEICYRADNRKNSRRWVLGRSPL